MLAIFEAPRPTLALGATGFTTKGAAFFGQKSYKQSMQKYAMLKRRLSEATVRHDRHSEKLREQRSRSPKRTA
jgi:hypothetical protein